MWDIGNTMAEGAAMMTGTKVTSRLLGSAWPQHMNKAVAETMYANIQKVGMPQPGARTTRRSPRRCSANVKAREQGLATEVGRLQGPTRPDDEHAAAAPTTSATCPGPCRP